MQIFNFHWMMQSIRLFNVCEGFLTLMKLFWGKEINFEACGAFYLYFTTNVINSIKWGHKDFYLSHDTEIIWS